MLHVAYSGAVSHCYVDIGLPQPVAVLLTNTTRDVPIPTPEAGDVVSVAWVQNSLTVLGE